MNKLARRMITCACALLPFAAASTCRGQDGSAAWLRYAAVTNTAMYRALPSRIAVLGDTPTDRAAAAELQKGLSSMLGRSFTVLSAEESRIAANVITLAAANSKEGALLLAGAAPQREGFHIATSESRGRMEVVILGGTPQGELYGAFHLLERVASQQPVIAEVQAPSAPIRWTDERDNLDGTVERGYAGASIFFDKGHVRQDLTRAAEYARLLSSVGINGVNVNNVNADPQTLSTEHLREYARIADVFRPWGVKLALSIDLTSPQVVGKLKSSAPLDPHVAAWWEKKVEEIYSIIPDFGGFTIQADSPGRKGSSRFPRTPANAINVLARALSGHDGVVLYRTRAGMEHVTDKSGPLAPNVVLQIEESLFDVPAGQAVSPLSAALGQSHVAIELQIAQQYTEQRHVIFLPALWKRVLDFDLRASGPDGKSKPTPLKSIVTGHAFLNVDGTSRMGGFVCVTNVGMETNWMHDPMAMVNLYGFGRLAWNPDTPPAEIENTWTRLTWGNDPEVDQKFTSLLDGR